MFVCSGLRDDPSKIVLEELSFTKTSVVMAFSNISDTSAFAKLKDDRFNEEILEFFQKEIKSDSLIF